MKSLLIMIWAKIKHCFTYEHKISCVWLAFAFFNICWIFQNTPTVKIERNVYLLCSELYQKFFTILETYITISKAARGIWVTNIIKPKSAYVFSCHTQCDYPYKCQHVYFTVPLMWPCLRIRMENYILNGNLLNFNFFYIIQFGHYIF